MKTYQIIGFPDYTIDERMEVVSLKHGKRRVMKGNGRSVVLSNGNRNEQYTFSKIRLLYAACKGVDPKMIDGDRFIFKNENGRAVVYEASEYRRIIMEKIKDRPAFSKEDTLRRYEEQKRFIDAVMDYLRTGDGREMTERLYACRAGAARWIAINYFNGRLESAEPFVDMAIEKTLESIRKGVLIVNSQPEVCVRNIARKLLFGYRRSKRMTEVYDDRILMKGIQGSI